MMTRPLGKTGFSIAPLVFGGNVFGWTIDEKTSFALLDAFVDHGFDAIDTADVYSRWAEGNQGGESETIIGRWLQARPGMRDKVKIFTKVGSDLGLPGHKGLSKAWIQQAVDDSLRRLNTDYIDLYFSHWPDPQTPVAETLEAFHSLQQDGKIRAMGASNLDAMQLAGALEVARKGGLPAWQVLQPEYNLYHRSAFEGALCDLCVSRDIGVVTYYSLASGFLTGKYRQPSDLAQSQRGGKIGKYLNPRGMRIIDTLAAVAEEQGAKPAEVALGVADRPRRGDRADRQRHQRGSGGEFCPRGGAEPERGASGAAGRRQRLRQSLFPAGRGGKAIHDADRRPGKAPAATRQNNGATGNVPARAALSRATASMLLPGRLRSRLIVCVMAVMVQGAHRGRPVAAAPCTPGLRPATSPLRGPFDLSLQASGRAEAASVQNTALSPHPCGLPRPSGNVSAMLRPQHRQFQQDW
ncbi:Oxidoreductase [Klebsiella pneumoniae]|nr:Oxidoreductase [Klebsiella pneumoniae]